MEGVAPVVAFRTSYALRSCTPLVALACTYVAAYRVSSLSLPRGQTFCSDWFHVNDMAYKVLQSWSPNVTSACGGLTRVTITAKECELHVTGSFTSNNNVSDLLVLIKIDLSQPCLQGQPSVQIARFLSPKHPVVVRVPHAICHSEGNLEVSIVSTYSGCPDLSAAPTWTPRFHPAITYREVSLARFINSLDSLAPGSQATSKQVFAGCSFASNGLCDFISGQEDGQWWTNETWEPSFGNCILDRGAWTKMMARSSLSILFVGDSQMRTSFQAVMGCACPGWKFHDYGGRAHFGWGKMGSKFDASRSRLIDSKVCGGSLRTISRDACWSGGALWQSHDYRHTIAYVSSLTVDDERYVNESWLSRHWQMAKRHGWKGHENPFYDIVIVGSDLHDVNLNVQDYAMGVRHRLDRVRQWHHGPIIAVSAWGVAQQKKDWVWAGTLAKASAMVQVLNEVSMTIEGVWSLSMLEPTLAARWQTRDGRHLLWEHPMRQVGDIIWHNIAHVLQNLSSRKSFRNRP